LLPKEEVLEYGSAERLDQLYLEVYRYLQDHPRSTSQELEKHFREKFPGEDVVCRYTVRKMPSVLEERYGSCGRSETCPLQSVV
jgi:hypothetical protein